MARFSFSTGNTSLRTDCPEIARTCGGKLLNNNAERQALLTLLQPHLDVQADIRELLKCGHSVTSDDTNARAVCDKINSLGNATLQRQIGACTVTLNGKS